MYTLLGELDDLDVSEKVLIIATTNSLDKLEKSIRRGGRLDLDIRLDMPTDNDRYLIFKQHLSHIPNSIDDGNLKMIARASSGFVSSDLAQIIRNCHMRAIKNHKSEVSQQDLEIQILESKPLSISDMIVEVPRVLWSEIGGNEDIKFQVRQCIEWPLKYPEKFEMLGLKPPQGIMLYGPPGCSKTMIAKALATESGLNFIAIKGPELFSKYVGDTEKAIREIFRKARLSAPSIIFFDEIDAMATQRGSDDTSVSDRALCQLLNEMDGVESRAKVIVVAATNRLDIIDTALLRPGRFDRLIKVPLPNLEARKMILTIGFKKMPLADDINLDELAQAADGLSGAEVSLVCREAGLKALTDGATIENMNTPEEINAFKIQKKFVEEALNEVKMRGKSEKKEEQKSLFS